MSIFATCTNCSLVFESSFGRIFGFSGAYVILSNNSEQCPRCGSPARIDDGLFYIKGRLIQAFTTIQRDPVLFGRLAAVARHRGEFCENKEASVLKILEASSVSNVTLRDWLQFAPTMLSLFLTAVGLYMLYLQGQENISEAELQRYVDRAIAQALSQFEPAEVGSLAQEPAKPVSEVGKTRPQKKPTAENRKMRRAQNAKDRKKAGSQK